MASRMRKGWGREEARGEERQAHLEVLELHFDLEVVLLLLERHVALVQLLRLRLELLCTHQRTRTWDWDSGRSLSP